MLQYSWLTNCSVLMLLCTLLSRFDVVLVLMKWLSHYVSSRVAYLSFFNAHEIATYNASDYLYYISNSETSSTSSSQNCKLFYVDIHNSRYVHPRHEQLLQHMGKVWVVQQLFSSPCRMLMSFVTESIGHCGWSIGDDGTVICRQISCCRPYCWRRWVQ